MSTPSRVDYLDTDPVVAGQQFCCISFVSPVSLVEAREQFYVREFLRAEVEKLGLKETPEQVLERFDQYKHHEEARLTTEFQKLHPTRSTVHALKLRGSYANLEQAKERAAYLQRIDPDFHVFVGQVGYWLPWNPRGDQLDEEVYAEEQLNELIGKYKENLRKTSEFYEMDTKRRLEEARREGQAGREATLRDAAEAGPSSSSTATEVMEKLTIAEEPPVVEGA